MKVRISRLFAGAALVISALASSACVPTLAAYGTYIDPNGITHRVIASYNGDLPNDLIFNVYQGPDGCYPYQFVGTGFLAPDGSSLAGQMTLANGDIVQMTFALNTADATGAAMSPVESCPLRNAPGFVWGHSAQVTWTYIVTATKKHLTGTDAGILGEAL